MRSACRDRDKLRQRIVALAEIGVSDVILREEYRLTDDEVDEWLAHISIDRRKEASLRCKVRHAHSNKFAASVLEKIDSGSMDVPMAAKYYGISSRVIRTWKKRKALGKQLISARWEDTATVSQHDYVVMRQLRDAGAKRNVIARALGLSPHSVGMALRKAPEHIRPRGKCRIGLDQSEVVACVAASEAAFGVSRMMVRDLHSHGVSAELLVKYYKLPNEVVAVWTEGIEQRSLPAVPKDRKRWSHLPPEIVTKISELHAIGATDALIAAAIGVGVSTVSTMWRGEDRRADRRTWDRLPEGDRRRYVEGFGGGEMSICQVARESGISHRTVRKHLGLAGVAQQKDQTMYYSFTPGRDELSDDMLMAAELYMSGCSIAEVCAEYNLSRFTAQLVFTYLGIMRTAGEGCIIRARQKLAAKVADGTVDRLCQDYREGKIPMRKLRELLHTDYYTTKALVRERNIPIRREEVRVSPEEFAEWLENPTTRELIETIEELTTANTPRETGV